ncbi:MAG: N-acetyl-gamma-glutamyl-phosphate reductase [Oscillospiraceae bacterium]|nr:N-acetyl-gamma-glutamyl-phosphate reductase [Oscillospiraceae bacterium]
MKIFIDGREGTTGLQIQQRLEALQGELSTFAELPQATSRNVRSMELIILDEDKRKDVNARREALQAADVAFLCLPDVAAREAVALAENSELLIIDASTAHRTTPGWAYGLPELSPAHREAVLTSNRIAVPGCHASGFCALIYPLIANGILDKNAALQCVSITGYTGGGKAMIAEYENNRATNDKLKAPRPYALELQHKHLPEIQAVCGLNAPPWFMPVLGDFPQGLLVTVPLTPAQMTKSMALNDVRNFYEKYYELESIIDVFPVSHGDDGGQLDPTIMAGNDGMEILTYGNDQHMMLAARLDNLGKGASGAAVQILKMRMGL